MGENGLVALIFSIQRFYYSVYFLYAVEGKRLAMLLGDLSTALGMMLGVLGCMTIMLFISLMAAIKTVSP